VGVFDDFKLLSHCYFLLLPLLLHYCITLWMVLEEPLSEELMQKLRTVGLDPFSITRSVVKRRMELEKVGKLISSELDLGQV
jgi:hypothetical protein